MTDYPRPPMLFPAGPNTGTREALRAISAALDNKPFTDLLRFHCEATHWRIEDSGHTLTFVMSGADKVQEMRALLPDLFRKIRKLYLAVGIEIFNIRATTVNQIEL